MKLTLNAAPGPRYSRRRSFGRGSGYSRPGRKSRWFNLARMPLALLLGVLRSAAGLLGSSRRLAAPPRAFMRGVRSFKGVGARMLAAPLPSIATAAAELKSDRRRLRVLWGVQVTIVALVALRLFMVQLIQHDRYASLARRQHMTQYKMPPSRGAILDRNSRPLAVSQAAAAIFMVPRYFFADRATARVKLPALCRLLGRSPRQVAAEASSKRFLWLKRPASLAQVEQVRQMCREERLEGVGWEPLCLRHYPEGPLASHLLGFTNNEGKGLEGLEYCYDRYLYSASNSLGALRDSRGNRIFTHGRHTAGSDSEAYLKLTIDVALQHAVERELERSSSRLRTRWGCAVVLNPNTGEILALANSPRYVPEMFRSATPRERMNHVVSTVFEPGSTFKMITLAAALQENLIQERDVFNCEKGAFALADAVIHDVEPYGSLSVAEMVAYSSNIGFAKVGLMLGADRLFAWAKRFGFGRETDLGIPGEERGLLRKAGERFSVAAMAFGQGLGVTPIQLAAAYGAVANGGVLMRPFVVREVRDAQGRLQVSNRPKAVRRVVSESVARRITKLLSGVVNYGTARLAAIPGYRIAGKTGTAQMSTSKGYLPDGHKIVTFVGFFPAEEPKYLVLVTLNSPRWGTAGVTAGPVFREIALAVIRHFGVPASGIGSVAGFCSCGDEVA